MVEDVVTALLVILIYWLSKTSVVPELKIPKKKVWPFDRLKFGFPPCPVRSTVHSNVVPTIGTTAELVAFRYDGMGRSRRTRIREILELRCPILPQDEGECLPRRLPDQFDERAFRKGTLDMSMVAIVRAGRDELITAVSGG